MRVSFIAGIGSFTLAAVMFAAAELYYLGEEAAGVFTSSATGDPLTILPELGTVFIALAIPFLLNTKLKVQFPDIRLTSMVVAAGCFAALATGFITLGGAVTPGGVWWNNYGFPVAWRVDIMVSCPPWCNSSDRTVYNPLFYAMDALFYIAIGYSAVLLGLSKASEISGTNQSLSQKIETGRVYERTKRSSCSCCDSPVRPQCGYFIAGDEQAE